MGLKLPRTGYDKSGNVGGISPIIARSKDRLGGRNENANTSFEMRGRGKNFAVAGIHRPGPNSFKVRFLFSVEYYGRLLLLSGNTHIITAIIIPYYTIVPNFKKDGSKSITTMTSPATKHEGLRHRLRQRFSRIRDRSRGPLNGTGIHQADPNHPTK